MMTAIGCRMGGGNTYAGQHKHSHRYCLLPPPTEGGCVFRLVCLSVRLITQKVVNGFG